MWYAAEPYYFYDQDDFPVRLAVEVTAVAVSQWCHYFQARLLAPRPHRRTESMKHGALPQASQAREHLVAELLAWLYENSDVETLFWLLMGETCLTSENPDAKFDFYDTPDNWYLKLTAAEFAQLQEIWRQHDLPADLFFAVDEGRCVAYPGSGLKARLLRALGVQKCYSPKQWMQIKTGPPQN